MIPHLIASKFHRFMNTGRTSPLLCGCEDASGNPAGDYVVKLRGGTERGVTGLLCELVASRVAGHFGISAPEPALVTIEAAFADLVARLQPSQAARVCESSGLAFASRQLNDVAIWPIDRPVPEAQVQAAVHIFAFDALIDNPDRSYKNPNLFTRGDEVFVFDHELAFSFLLAIQLSPTPWRLDGKTYLDDHVFGRCLKSKSIELGTFEAALANLPAVALDGIVAEIPEEWNNEYVTRIERHLCDVSAHAVEFTEEVRRRLA
jgi:hypothetical protein